MAYALAFLWAWLWILKLVATPRLWPDDTPPMSTDTVNGGRLWIFLGVVLGARIGYVLFYNPAYYLRHPIEVLTLWNGGMSFHGGVIGVVIAGLIYASRHRIPRLSGFDSLAMTLPFGLFIGRIANFFNGELWGHPSRLPWAMVFPGPRAQICPEGWIGPCTRHPSQLYEALLEGLLLSAVLFWLAWRRNALKIPGQISAVFLLGYGLARFTAEFFRQADPQFTSTDNPLGHVLRLGHGPDALGLTMGQILTLPMILIGLGALVYLRRRAARSKKP